jgi:mRNA interferase MazF
VVVLPVTSNVSSLYPGEARIRIRGKPARLLGDHIRSIDKARLRARLATLTRDELRDVEVAVEITLGLGPA